MAAAAILDVQKYDLWPQICQATYKGNWFDKFYDIVNSFGWNIAFYRILYFGWEIPDHAHFLAVFGGWTP